MEKAVAASGYKGFDGVVSPTGEHQTYGIAYATLVVPLVKAVQEQQLKIEAQGKNAAGYQEQIDQLKKEIEVLKKLLTEKQQNGN
jgi:trimeric autotransporter adhesin